MKKVLCFIWVFAICLSLCACSFPISDEEINSFLSSLSDSKDFAVETSEKTLEKSLESENFSNLLNQHLEKLISEENYDSAVQLISRLDTLNYPTESLTAFLDSKVLEILESSVDIEEVDQALKIIRRLSRDNYVSENLKARFQQWLDAFQAKAFCGDATEMISYIELVKSYMDDIAYTSIIECFPYLEMKEYFESKGTKAIVYNEQGGYYDAIRTEFEDEDYWYSPLFGERSRSGSVGTYHHTVTHRFGGDFMELSTSKYWYNTDRNDSNNSYSTELYFKGEYIGNANRLDLYTLERESFVIDNLYYIQSDNDILIASVEDARIIIIHDKEMVTIAYE